MPRAGAVSGFLVLVVAVAVAALGFWVGSKVGRDKTTLVEPAAEFSILTSTPEFLAQRCRAESGFDPETSHWSTVYEVSPGIRVHIVPHLQSNKHTLNGLGRGKVVAKFVNASDSLYLPLALPKNGTSCLFIQSTRRPDAEEDQLVARAIAAGAEMEHTFKSFRIDFHDSAHKTPLARWYDRDGRLLTAQRTGAGALDAMFQLAAFPAVAQDSSAGGGSGPAAWVTCVSNGCCRMGLLDE